MRAAVDGCQARLEGASDDSDPLRGRRLCRPRPRGHEGDQLWAFKHTSGSIVLTHVAAGDLRIVEVARTTQAGFNPGRLAGRFTEVPTIDYIGHRWPVGYRWENDDVLRDMRRMLRNVGAERVQGLDRPQLRPRS